ncbi:MAG: metallophosphoesterase [Candidatus Latescibacteria bacterium]|nr:metallophosphoesterase [Candidatus Latescibacterota bacterium]
MFYLNALILLGLVYGYTGWRLIDASPLGPPWPAVAWAAVLGCMLLVPGYMFFIRPRLARSGRGDWLAWIVYLTMGLFALTFGLTLIRDLAWALLWGLESLLALSGRPPLLDAAGRDLLWRSSATAVGVLSILGWLYGLYAARTPRVTRIDIPLDDLPADLEGFRIVQLTDLHVGPTIKRPFVQKVVDQVQTLAPDLIVFTGDLADGSVEHLSPHVAPLAGLKAPFGRFFASGNHEYYSGVEAWLEQARHLGFLPLINQHHLITKGAARLLLAGVTDFNAAEIKPEHASDPKAALRQAPDSHLRILLAHQPRSIKAAAQAGFDLQLSGHTHGGQFVPWKYFIRLQQPYVAGLHRFADAWIYVSRGTGYWGPPLRLGAPAEIAHITLSKKTATNP